MLLVGAYSHLHALDAHVTFLHNIVSAEPPTSLTEAVAPSLEVQCHQRAEQAVQVIARLSRANALRVGQEVATFCMEELLEYEQLNLKSATGKTLPAVAQPSEQASSTGF